MGWTETMHNLAEVLRNTSDLNRTLELDRRALIILEKTVGKDHPRYGAALASIGEDLRRLGRPAESLAYQKRAQEIFRARMVDRRRVHLAANLAYRGLALADLGRNREAIPILERALDLLPSTDPDRARVAFALARALEPRRPSSQRALVLTLEALSTFAVMRAKREIDQVAAYLARGNRRKNR